MQSIKHALKQHNISQQSVADAVSISQAALNLILNKGVWPKRKAEAVKAALIQFLTEHDINTEKLGEVQTAGTDCTSGTTSQKDDYMLLAKQALFPATKKHFGIFRDPFSVEIESDEDVFTTPDIRYVRESMYQTAVHGGFIAVVGESGSGKSTLRRDLADKIIRAKAPVIIIEPYVLAMEDNDMKGKTLKASAIAEAIINTIAPLEGVKRSQDARFRQLHRVLKESSRAGYSHVLVIEEAHSLPIPTLKHLKRFFELEDGFKKLLSVVLIGQPELAIKLSERNMEVREVVQRCEIVNLHPLDEHLENYLAFKLGRCGKQMPDVFSADAVEAIRAKLTSYGVNRKSSMSLLYPLAVGNMVTAAMNMAVELGVPNVTADVVQGV